MNSQNPQSKRLTSIKNQLEEESKSSLETLRWEQENNRRTLENITQDHDALAQALQNLRTQQEEGDKVIDQRRVTIKEKDRQIKRHEQDLAAEQEDSLAKFTTYVSQIVDKTDSFRAKMAEADLHFDRAQERASQLIFGPERSLEAGEKSGREARTKLDGELKMARDHIYGVMSTIRSNSQELQMYRDRAKA